MTIDLRSAGALPGAVLLSGALVLAGCDAPAGSGGSPDAEAAQAPATGERDSPSFFARIFQPEPVEVTVPPGTVLVVRFDDTLSSHASQVGEAFTARVQQDVASDGRTAIPAGSLVLGTVREARGPKKVGGRAVLSLDFHTLELPDGQTVSIAASFARTGKSETPKDAAIIAGGTLAGAVLGEEIHEGEGGVLGAIVGGLAGTAGAIKTRGKPVVVAAGTTMSLELDGAVTLEVET